MRQIAFYGKGGIGKSTTTSNISAALARKGCRIMQIGCDPKSDSTVTLTNGKRIPTVLDTIRDIEMREELGLSRKQLCIEDLVYKGYSGVLCCEAGGPEPGIGCAGRGIITAIEMLQAYRAFDIYKPEFVFYDVLGDVVCGGFAMPIRKGLAKEIYVITSGEMMSIYASNNIFRGISKFAKTGDTRVGGIIINSRGVKNEVETVSDFAEITGITLLHIIPRNDAVQQSELMGMTVVEANEDSVQAEAYLTLAQKIVDNPVRSIPKPMEPAEFSEWMKTKGAKY